MILDCAKYSGRCACGMAHPMETRLVVAEYGALRSFDRYKIGRASCRERV